MPSTTDMAEVRKHNVLGEPWECPDADCHFVTKRKNCRAVHKKRHRREKAIETLEEARDKNRLDEPEACPVEGCDFESDWKAALARHAKAKHPDEKVVLSFKTYEPDPYLYMRDDVPEPSGRSTLGKEDVLERLKVIHDAPTRKVAAKELGLSEAYVSEFRKKYDPFYEPYGDDDGDGVWRCDAEGCEFRADKPQARALHLMAHAKDEDYVWTSTPRESGDRVPTSAFSTLQRAAERAEDDPESLFNSPEHAPIFAAGRAEATTEYIYDADDNAYLPTGEFREPEDGEYVVSIGSGGGEYATKNPYNGDRPRVILAPAREVEAAAASTNAGGGLGEDDLRTIVREEVRSVIDDIRGE